MRFYDTVSIDFTKIKYCAPIIILAVRKAGHLNIKATLRQAF